MIQCSSQSDTYQATFTNGGHTTVADVPREKGGEGRGFGPHELLEAALATCMTISIHKYAVKHGLPVDGVTSEVSIDRSMPGEVALEYSLKFDGQLLDDQIEQLREAARNCPVARTLTGTITLVPAVQIR
jgi:putative redox protein